MSSIGTSFPNPTAATRSAGTNSTGTNSTTAASESGTNGLGNQATFLNLLVAQLKNQDPTSPVDGTAFVTQLAEFNNVQQNLAIRQDMDAVSTKYLGTTTPPSAAAAGTETASSTPTNS